MKIFITGGTGFIGQNLIPKLAARGHSLLLLSRTGQKSKQRSQFIKGNLAQIKKWREKFLKFKPDAVIHLAWEGLAQHDFGSEISARNLEHNANMLFLAADAGVKKFLSMGGSWEYGRAAGKFKENEDGSKPQHVPYFVAAKRAAHFLGKELSLQSGMQFIWMRLFFGYGPGQREGALIPYMVQAFKNGKTPLIKNKMGGNDFIYIEDAAEAIVKILEKSKKQSAVYNIGSGQLSSVAHVANLVAKEFGRENFLKEPKNPQGFYADISLIKKEIGWKPRTSLEQGIKKTVNYFKKA